MYLYFAGGEAHCERLHDYGVRRMLASFYYIWKKPKQKGFHYMDNMFAKYGTGQIPGGVEWFMDSGAFTLQMEQPDDTTVENFLNTYIYSLQQWKSCINCAVELDLDNFMGMGWVRYARDRIVAETGISPIIVHHPETRTLQEFRENCKEYPYMGFSIGDAYLFNRTSAFMPFYMTAMQHKTKLHAFGITQPVILKRYHFYSADSFSWSMGAKFGTTFVNKRWDMLRYNNYQKTIRRTLVSKAKRYGVPVIDILNDKYVAVDKMNVISWIECEQTIDKKWGLHYAETERELTNVLPPRIGIESTVQTTPVDVRVLSKNRQLNVRNFFSRSADPAKARAKKIQGMKDRYASKLGRFSHGQDNPA